ncbi:ATP-binding protein [Dactylosporangium salmoneum]|uniref:Histidine kinase/HSP90-like ATPase domain-containing protein n=1 Tax=Dactylosporangium salmoneum TaxID=53361 RepID=A0ABN3G335_9ACTN
MAEPGRADSIGYALVSDLAAVRAFVTDRAIALGLSPARADLLTLAVNELATNTLQYTDEGGQVLMWAEPGQVVCDVVDQGPVRAFGGGMPPADAPRGRGLAIVEMVCDHVAAFAGAGGTVVRMRLGFSS